MLRLSFDVSNTDVRVGVAVGNAGEVEVVAFLDSLFVTYEGCSRSHYSVNCSSFIAMKCQYATKFPSTVLHSSRLCINLKISSR